MQAHRSVLGEGVSTSASILCTLSRFDDTTVHTHTVHTQARTG